MITSKPLFCLLLTFSVCLLFTSVCSAQINKHEKLRKQLTEVTSTASGRVGVAIRLLETGDTLSILNEQHYPMQSVFKFPIAVCLLRAVEKHRINLNDQIFIPKSDLNPTISALLEKYPQGNVKVPLREILTDMVTLSDNNACDILMRLLGGPAR